jgi:hypothetical protein
MGTAGVVAMFVVMAVLVVVAYLYWPVGATACPQKLHRELDGSLKLLPGGQTFPDMNAFQQWWHSSGMNASCPLPLLTGAREVPVLAQESSDEQTYAKTPIYKVDDYEFSRIFGYERDGHMDIPRQNFNVILENRTFDWADRPLSSDERRAKYAGLKEGFTTAGELKSVPMDSARVAAARYGERVGGGGVTGGVSDEDDIECKIGREAREVAKMVARAYENEPNWEPVVTKVGPNHWEVNELKPRRRYGEVTDEVVDERVVDTANDKVDVEFRYREKAVVEAAIDPFYISAGNLPFESERQQRDPYYGPVPGMERMFGPTFDHKRWY